MSHRRAALFLILASLGIGPAIRGQQPDISIKIIGERGKVRIAVPEFRATNVSPAVNEAFNSTLWNDLESSGVFEMVSKSLYPTETPQKPEDFKPPKMPPVPPPRRLRPGEKPAPAPTPIRQGPWLTDWSQPPASAVVLAFGSTAMQDDRFALSGWLYEVDKPDVASAHILGKRYLSDNDVAGARRVAHEFSSDILQRLGAGPGIAGTRTYFVSNRTGYKEIWAMDYDGSNQVPITQYKSITINPEISPDGSMLAFTTFARGNPGIFIHSLETNRRLTFYNQVASLNATPSFSPDGKRLAFASSASGRAQIYIANIDGSNLRRISNSLAVEVEPKFNPRTGAQIAFVSGRAGPPQIYLTDADGTNVQRLTPGGGGDAVNPAWSPDGQRIAFAWTKGFEPGNYNIFIQEVATGTLTQLTFGAGRNEHPSWAPDGRHIVFASNRAGGTQIWTMLADGTHVKQLTTLGRNEQPVWGVK
ncbi:MAG: PD40 domain-containing protein [Acidobacteria bacterium]|nr:PD40 domain-containing protein [Acidobacteriota bacterium]